MSPRGKTRRDEGQEKHGDPDIRRHEDRLRIEKDIMGVLRNLASISSRSKVKTALDTIEKILDDVQTEALFHHSDFAGKKRIWRELKTLNVAEALETLRRSYKQYLEILTAEENNKLKLAGEVFGQIELLEMSEPEKHYWKGLRGAVNKAFGRFEKTKILLDRINALEEKEK